MRDGTDGIEKETADSGAVEQTNSASAPGDSTPDIERRGNTRIPGSSAVSAGSAPGNHEGDRRGDPGFRGKTERRSNRDAHPARSALDELEAQMATLRQAYTTQLPGKIERLQELHLDFSAALDRIEARHDYHRNQPHGEERDQSFGEAISEFHRLVHNLAGSGQSYGFRQLSATARELDVFLKNFEPPHSPPGPDARAQIAVWLRRLAEISANPTDAPTSNISKYLQAPQTVSAEDNRLVYLLEDDIELGKELALQLSPFGYTIRPFEDTVSVCAAIEDEAPAAIIADIILSEGPDAGLDCVSQIRSKSEVPVLFISARGDIEARLRAVRAQGSAYFTKPIDPAELVDKLDSLTARDAPLPYRILIVDDEPALASYYGLTLQSAGMITATVTDPLRILQPLTDFRPDLILMDMYMPHCTGQEIAMVIRQQADFVSIPIVFLSAEQDIEKQLDALSSGGDDFLTKPIEPEHLISSVATRAKRSRTLRSFIIRDSLTGLLNHTTVKERLSIEYTRAERLNSPLSFAMLDIDSFKSINDRFGHMVGDRVIKSLSRILQQRLRKTDIIGRYGGEEFAVIMTDTEGQTAARVLDEIRVGFSQIRHRTPEGDFEVTFSCGVAEFPTYHDPATLNDAADQALYAAKRGGRNRVLVSDPVDQAS